METLLNLKRASVAVAMNKGKQESQDFRTQLKDESEAQAPEQQAKAVTDSKGLEELISSLSNVEKEPENLNGYRQLRITIIDMVI